MMDAYLAKADQALKTARRNLDEGDTAAGANRAYYAMHSAMQAALSLRGAAQPRTHTGMIAVFSDLFVKPGLVPITLGRAIGRAFELRGMADYGETAPSREDAEQALRDAEEFVRSLRRLSGQDQFPFAAPD